MPGAGNGWRGLSLEMIRRTGGRIAYIGIYLVFFAVAGNSDQEVRVEWLVDGGAVGEIEARFG
jgi:hypothetical protein